MGFLKRNFIRGISIILTAFLFFGCAYHGNLKNDFKPITNQTSKLPLKACLVFDNSMEQFNYRSEMFGGHSVDISGQPGLKLSMVNTFNPMFEELYVISNVYDEKIGNTDVVMFPTLESKDNGTVLYMSLLIKKTETDEILHKYESTSDTNWQEPALSSILGIINICSAFLLSPIIIPSQTHLIGNTATKTLEKGISTDLDRISNDMKNDRSLVKNALMPGSAEIKGLEKNKGDVPTSTTTK